MMNYIFGPVPSRRLGFSLGVDIIPQKYCCFDCVYCQVGRTSNSDLARKSFQNPQEIVDTVIKESERIKDIDFITFSGSGEPTLNSDIGMMIREVKRRTDIPVAVITNGALLYQPAVREDLMSADVVLPSLDAVSEDLFRYVNRPHSLLDIETIISGLKAFRKEYSGKIWLEIMLIKNINDDMDELKRFKKVLAEIGADKIHLNTVTRPPSDEICGSLTIMELETIRDFFGPNCEIISSFDKSVSERRAENWPEGILEILKRRSLTFDDMVRITGLPAAVVKSRLSVLEEEGKIRSNSFDGNLFYMIS